jgi:acetoacetyl-CoA reductase
MRAAKFGRVVNIGSVNGQAGQYGQVNYAAAKSGIHGFTKALAQEGARFGITVNAIAPGYILTPLTQAIIDEGRLDKSIVERRTPMGRFGNPMDIAKVAVFLLSDDAGYVTGQVLPVDGGMTAGDTSLASPTLAEIEAAEAESAAS